MAYLELKDISKEFNNKKVLDKVNIKVEEGEIYTLLGPSGCGKSTLLRIIAGLEKEDSGEILLNGGLINNIEASKRNITMVFQHYSIFPSMNVEDNIAYGIKIKDKGKSKEEIKDLVNKYLGVINMEGFNNRNINELSGGEMQRVAIARALAINPKLLLMDEPLSNLDAKLRKSLRGEIKRIQEELGTTIIYVTHDKEEALMLSSKISIMDKGHIVESGRPHEIYNHGRTNHAANFLGEANNFNEEFLEKLGYLVPKGNYYIRPEKIKVTPTGKLKGIIEELFFQGEIYTLRVSSEGKIFTITLLNDKERLLFEKGDRIRFDIDLSLINKLKEDLESKLSNDMGKNKETEEIKDKNEIKEENEIRDEKGIEEVKASKEEKEDGK